MIKLMSRSLFHLGQTCPNPNPVQLYCSSQRSSEVVHGARRELHKIYFITNQQKIIKNTSIYPKHILTKFMKRSIGGEKIPLKARVLQPMPRLLQLGISVTPLRRAKFPNLRMKVIPSLNQRINLLLPGDPTRPQLPAVATPNPR